jgi:hypothetical protein
MSRSMAAALAPAGGEDGAAADFVPFAGLACVTESTAPATGLTTLPTVLLTVPSALPHKVEFAGGWPGDHGLVGRQASLGQPGGRHQCSQANAHAQQAPAPRQSH